MSADASTEPCGHCGAPTDLEDLTVCTDDVLRCASCVADIEERHEDARDMAESRRCDEAMDARRGL